MKVFFKEYLKKIESLFKFNGTPRLGFEPRCPKGPGVPVLCNTRLCDLGIRINP